MSLLRNIKNDFKTTTLFINLLPADYKLKTYFYIVILFISGIIDSLNVIIISKIFNIFLKDNEVVDVYSNDFLNFINFLGIDYYKFLFLIFTFLLLFRLATLYYIKNFSKNIGNFICDLLLKGSLLRKETYLILYSRIESIVIINEYIDKFVLYLEMFSLTILSLITLVAASFITINLFRVYFLSLISVPLIYLILSTIFQKYIQDVSKKMDKFKRDFSNDLEQTFLDKIYLQVENLIEKKLVFLREIDYIIRNLKVKVTLLSILPKYLVEYFLIIIVIVNLSILRNYSSGFTLNASSLAGFAFAIKKILEVYQSFYSNYINMISERTFVDTLYKQIIFDGNNKKPPIIENKEKEFIKKEKINVINVVEFRNNKKKNAYKKSLLNIRDLLVYNNSGEASFLRNLDINEGDQIIIEGPSGCGKSTLLKSLLGVYKDLKGGIYQDKKNILTDKNQLIKWHKSVCYVPQFTEIKFSSLKEIFNVEEFNDKVQLINTILDNVGLSYLKSNLSNDNDKYRTFSGGELQRLSIARALFSCKNIFFLDESFSALDANNEKSIRNYLVSSISNITIVEIAHKAKNKDFYNKVVDFY